MLYKFNSLVRICIVLFLIVPVPVLADHVPTQTPYGISIACDSDGDTTKGDITVTWQESDGFESSPPERYAIAFSNDNFVQSNYAVASTPGWETALSYKSYVFTASYRENVFGTTADTFYAKVRADNDTDQSYSEWTSIVSIDCDYGSTPTTTTTSSTTTTSTTTTSTTTTTPPPPPPPPPPTPEEIIVDEKVEGVDKTYTQADVNDGTLDRDKERVANEQEFGCFMTNAQIERGDCDIPETKEDVEIIEEEVIIVEEEVIDEKIEENVEVIVLENDVDVLDTPKEEILEDEVVEFKEQPIEFEIIEFDLEDIATEIVDEIPIQDETIEEIEDEKNDEKILDESIQEIVEEDINREIPEEPIEESLKLTEEEVQVEIAQIEEIVDLPITEETDEEAKQEAIQTYVQDLTEEEVVEVLEEVNDIGVQNLSQASEEIQEVVQAVVEEAITNVQELTEEQVEVVAEVLQVEADDVKIVAAAVENNKAVAEAVEEYVERSVQNKDVENYSLADVTTEIQTEQFLADPIGAFTNIQIENIDLSIIGSDMTSDQKEKAQEVVVPVIIASQIIASVQVVPVRMRRIV